MHEFSIDKVTPALVALRQRKEAAWNMLTLWGSANTFGKSPEGLVEIDIAYRRAQNEFSAATQAYEAALNEAAREENNG